MKWPGARDRFADMQSRTVEDVSLFQSNADEKESLSLSSNSHSESPAFKASNKAMKI